MTKERRLAIEMWERIIVGIKMGTLRSGLAVDRFKSTFCEEHNLNWQHDCWFCQYVRHDYRANLPSREDIEIHSNNCYECPLYKYLSTQIAPGSNGCGCDTTLHTPLYSRVLHELDIEAAELIMKALKGEEIWK